MVLTNKTIFFSTIIIILSVLIRLPNLQAQFLNEITAFGNYGFIKTKVLEMASNSGNGCTMDDEGRLYIAGLLNYYTEDGRVKNLSFVSRFLPDGEPDSSFGVNGTWKAEIGLFGSEAHDIVFHKNKILVSGFSYTGINNMSELYALRLTSEGVLDQSFSDDGFVMTGVQRYILDCGKTSVSILNNDKIVLQWYARNSGSRYGTNYIDRLNWDGSYDISFDNDGHFQFDSYVSVLVKPMCAIAPEGNFTLIGKKAVSPYTCFLQSFHADGSLAHQDLELHSEISNPQAIKFDPDGNLFVAFKNTSSASINLMKKQLREK